MAIALVILRMDMLTNQSLTDVNALYSTTEGRAELIQHRQDPSAPYRDSFYTEQEAPAGGGGAPESVYAHLLRYLP